MTNTTKYRWIAERVTKTGVRTTTHNSYLEAAGVPVNRGVVLRVALVRFDNGSSVGSGYAYVEDGHLPERFDDGQSVPDTIKDVWPN